MGGLAYGMFVKPLIGLPLNDRRYRPINLLSFDNVTRNSSDVKLETDPKMPINVSKTTFALEHILYSTEKCSEIT